MNQFFLVYGFILVMLLAMVLLAVRSNGALSQKLARVRVRIEENRRRNLPEPPEKDFDLVRLLELLVLSILLLLICMLLSKV